uniref:UBX domain-containing protein n=1 Tax=Amphora coffeiformis TaxID=265554 RepID=A0A7S3KZA6_9STRA|mmetsp:Transcript_5631/g.11226  ORF Transcript_5631/g.11226 Transcript_5631/m.11226 type:complete len:292 (+) Transcript_5631:305-1180(+)
MLATGKQFGLESLSYKTVLLDDQNILSAGEHARHVTVPDAVERYGIQLDPLLLGGMIPVQTTHVMICSLEWVRTFYAEPTKRLKESSIASPGGGHRLGGAPREDDDNGRTAPPMVSGPEIRALFVRNSTVAAMEEDVHDMTSKLQGLIAAKRQAKASSSQQTQSFTGQGHSLGRSGTTTPNSSSSTNQQEGVVWDPRTLPDTPPPLNAAHNTTSIAVRRLDGKRQIIKLNVTHTIQDLATHLKQAAGVDVPGMIEPFRLVGGYPPKALVDPSATIAKAGLTGAQVTMQKVS